MANVEGNGWIVEEESRDIHMVYEEPIEVESDPEEEPMEEEPETDPDETPIEDRILGEYEERILELEAEAQDQEEEIQKLREENEQQKLKMQEMEVELAHRKEAGIQMGTLFHRSVARNVELVGRLEESEHRELSEKAEKEALRLQLEMEVMERIHFEEKYEEANDRAIDLENEVRCKKRKTNKMGYAFRTAMERLVDGVYHYPAEQGQTRYTVSRDLVAHITQQEFISAVERGMLG